MKWYFICEKSQNIVGLVFHGNIYALAILAALEITKHTKGIWPQTSPLLVKDKTL